MELRHLRYFAAVARERNFTRAADRLGVAQPPLSRQIRELEAEIGVILFDRASRPVRLTEAGRLFHDQASQILAGVDQLQHSMRRFAVADRRRFVIGFVGSVVYGVMPQLVRQFRAAAPHLDVDLVEMTTLEQVAALKEGRIDAALGRLRIDDGAVRRVVLLEEPLVAAVARGSSLAGKGDPVSLRDLAAETLVVYPNRPRPSYADQVLRIFRDQGLAPAHVHEVHELQTALGLVAAQGGIALVPQSVQRLRLDDVLFRPVLGEGVTSPIIMNCRSNDVSAETGIFDRLARAIYASVNANADIYPGCEVSRPDARRRP